MPRLDRPAPSPAVTENGRLRHADGGPRTGRSPSEEASVARRNAVRFAATALIDGQRPDGSPAGRFDQAWRAVTPWSRLTGDAQTAIVWPRLFQPTAELVYRQAAQRPIACLKTILDLRAHGPGVRGRIKGSHPIWGTYASDDYPSCAAKSFADALMLDGIIGGEASPAQ